MTEKKSKKREQISPEKYARILNKTELVGLYLESSKVDFHRKNYSLKKPMEVSIREKATYDQKDDRVFVTHKYFLTVKPSEMKKVFSLKISAAFVLIYQADPSFSDDFFDVFKSLSLPINSWPYFREFVQNMTSRMNIPPVTLPLLIRD